VTVNQRLRARYLPAFNQPRPEFSTATGNQPLKRKKKAPTGKGWRLLSQGEDIIKQFRHSLAPNDDVRITVCCTFYE
jgi:glutaredoxin 2